MGTCDAERRQYIEFQVGGRYTSVGKRFWQKMQHYRLTASLYPLKNTEPPSILPE